ncbi:uncharacterized protein LOC106074513 [Biomphalaria glabrata]|uniref:Uncharacterized protein LOC106074513 n=1 Tax=Biomphalaria glabrata TaxID=6526 RepID=A0A9W3BFJ3_BIOGL|nr:uncharacterized protein LOC106074513 [Biomphalaria glabrata]
MEALDDDKYIDHNPEAEPYAKFKFTVERSLGLVTFHNAECGLQTAIFGLKQDLKSLFNIPAERQVWTLRNRVLDDTKCLENYGITGIENESTRGDGIQIVVKSTI